MTYTVRAFRSAGYAKRLANQAGWRVRHMKLDGKWRHIVAPDWLPIWLVLRRLAANSDGYVDPLNAARGVMFGVMLSIPIWAGIIWAITLAL